MTRASRYITSLVMTAIYLLVIFAPLAPAALQSKFVLHAVTGECSGDCRICGCSAERSAARNCCCWQKKLALKASDNDRRNRSCDKQHESAKAATPSCCNKKQAHCDQDDHSSDKSSAETRKEPTGSQVAAITVCPCGSARHLALHGLDNIQHYPFVYSVHIPLSLPVGLEATHPGRLSSRNIEPPEPPPKISVIS